MLLSKSIFACLGVSLLFLAACSQPKIVYTCPFGVGYLTQNDFETISDEKLISDDFATWLLATNLYCEANDGSI